MAERIQNEWHDGDAFRAGRSMGLAAAALALSAVSFLTMLSAEKAILAIVLGVVALRDASPATSARKLAVGAISLAAVFLVMLGVLLTLFWSDAIELIQQLQKLS